MAKDLQSHITAITSDTISDIHQSTAWKMRYGDRGPFQGDSRGISLSICTDGMNPFERKSCIFYVAYHCNHTKFATQHS